jgi:hypothetical protein
LTRFFTHGRDDPVSEEKKITTKGHEMNISLNRSKVVAAALAPFALAGAVITPAAAAKPARADYSRGFHIYNLSGNQIKLLNIDGDGNFEGRPADGSTLSPGTGYQDVEVQFKWLSNQTDTAHYAVIGDDGKQLGTFDVTMSVYGGDGGMRASCKTTVGQCSVPDTGDPLRMNDTITLLDAPGTVRDIPASQGQAQAQVLKNLCSADNSATCQFAVKDEKKIQSDPHQVGRSLINNTNVQQDTSVETTDTVGTTDSVGVSVSVGGKIAGLVSVEVAAEYNHEWTASHEFKQTVDVHVQPHSEAWIEAQQPMLRDTGDFTLTLGNTTWKLHDVYFDSPDPKGNGSYTVNDKPLTPPQQAQLPNKFYTH